MHDIAKGSYLRPAPRAMYRTGGWSGSPWLHAYAVLVALTIWTLIFSGGLVTSKGVGLSVPDWPTTYGYNMFAFPISRWVGGIFYEHSHRLLASAVGMMTIGLMVWLWISEKRRWVCWLGVAALGAVVMQGVLGGLRVVWLKDQIGIFHACLAQAFLALVSFIALATSSWWDRLIGRNPSADNCHATRAIAWLAVMVAGLIYMQLALGAGMRHAHAGLSIRDFPTAYGKWWPATDASTVAAINHERTESLGMPPTSGGQILLQMFHRMGASLVGIAVLVLTWKIWKARASLEGRLWHFGLLGPLLIAMQITLGIYTVWTNKAADVATSHVAVGAASLVWSVVTAAGLMVWSRAGSRGQDDTIRHAGNGAQSALAELTV